MPPEQCPSCGRFLREALVEELEDDPRPCPHCGDPLTAEVVIGDAATAAGGGSTGPSAPRSSVRPPDLPPDSVRDQPDDVLVGWDLGASAAEVASWQADRRPVPVDTIVVASAALSGAGIGVAVDRRRGRGALLGLVGGAVLAGVVRRVWRLTG